MEATEATLVVGPSWVGDMVMAQALLRQLVAEEPARAVDVLAPGWSLPIVARMPEVRDGIASASAHGELGLRRRLAVARSLRGRYDRAIVLPRSLKAALIPYFARIPARRGYRGEWRYGLINDMIPFDAQRLDQTVKRFLGLGNGDIRLSPALQPRLRIDAANQAALIERLGLETTRPVVAMMPGAEYGPAKCWPLEHFAELAALLATGGFDVWVLGSAKDRPAGERIAAAGHARNLCGDTGLADAVDLLGLCGDAVSNDSGLMHVAAAVGCHVQAVYGSSSPGFTPPLTAACDIHYLGLDCSPCFERRCPLGHLRCLQDIAAGSVLRKIESRHA